MDDKQWIQEFAMKLRFKMSTEGINQRQLASRSGISETTISRYLAGTQEPKVYALVQIAKALRASIFELIPYNR